LVVFRILELLASGRPKIYMVLVHESISNIVDAHIAILLTCLTKYIKYGDILVQAFGSSVILDLFFPQFRSVEIQEISRRGKHGNRKQTCLACQNERKIVYIVKGTTNSKTPYDSLPVSMSSFSFSFPFSSSFSFSFSFSSKGCSIKTETLPG
jgi:hypothetical protein